MMPTDERWAVLAPLVEACRARAKTPPRDLRRTIEAVLWRPGNGARRRAIPRELGPCWRAARLFIRWSRLGVRRRRLVAAQERGVALGMAFLDGTSIRAHPEAGGPAKGRHGPGARPARGARPLTRRRSLPRT